MLSGAVGDPVILAMYMLCQKLTLMGKYMYT